MRIFGKGTGFGAVTTVGGMVLGGGVLLQAASNTKDRQKTNRDMRRSVACACTSAFPQAACAGVKYSIHSSRIPAMSTDTPPDRLALDNRSPYFNEAALDRGIGVRFKGVEYTNVAEYCVSEGWIRLPVGKSLDRRGNAMTFKHIGPVEVWYLT